ncbi:UxaA family hydrolase [Halalkalibacter alkalisediminis]|uniref:UxaA family hydrolase n=1 Tax=Halalkalibacter alkalisediminis TaxID=935616 RepID=UPI0023626D7A|nr:UxaA family hydrolase [Halalkalibacter alkalisediminis]
MSNSKFRTIVMRPEDSVAVALQEIAAGIQVEVNVPSKESITILLKETIEFGHKFSIRPIKAGSDIMKYGEVIGRALKNIEEGEHVHVHNLEGTRGRGDKVVTD